MKTLLALALLCGPALVACSTATPPPAAPQTSIAKAASAETSSGTQPSQPAKTPEMTPEMTPTTPAAEVGPKASEAVPKAAESAPKASAKPAPPAPAPATSKSATPKAPAKPATTAAPKTEAAAAPKPEAVARAPTPALPPAPAAKPAPLDLKSLEQRLKDSNAIGLMTKLSLKNQVDDLVGRFRAYHSGERPPTLPQLRPAFELLLMKVLSLLQDKDPGLAHDIDASREAIWGVLSDRARFAQFT